VVASLWSRIKWRGVIHGACFPFNQTTIARTFADSIKYKVIKSMAILRNPLSASALKISALARANLAGSTGSGNCTSLGYNCVLGSSLRLTSRFYRRRERRWPAGDRTVQGGVWDPVAGLGVERFNSHNCISDPSLNRPSKVSRCHPVQSSTTMSSRCWVADKENSKR
jgi:hypothetical protein